MIGNAKTLIKRLCEQDESKIHEIKVKINGEYHECDELQELPPCDISRDMMDAFNYSFTWLINNAQHKKGKNNKTRRQRMKVKLLDGGKMPRRAHFDDAGMDFFSPEDFGIPAHGAYLIDLKVCVEIPLGFFGKMESKSGLMTKKGIVCAGGVIDSSFTGSIKVRMENHGDEYYRFNKGDKVVQMVLIPCLLPTLEQVDELDPPISGRGESGWGSTGR